MDCQRSSFKVHSRLSQPHDFTLTQTEGDADGVQRAQVVFLDSGEQTLHFLRRQRVYCDLENTGKTNQTSAVPRYQSPVFGLAQCAAYHSMKVLDGTRGWTAFQLLIQASLNLLRSEVGQLAAP